MIGVDAGCVFGEKKLEIYTWWKKWVVCAQVRVTAFTCKLHVDIIQERKLLDRDAATAKSYSIFMLYPDTVNIAFDPVNSLVPVKKTWSVNDPFYLWLLTTYLHQHSSSTGCSISTGYSISTGCSIDLHASRDSGESA